MNKTKHTPQSKPVRTRGPLTLQSSLLSIGWKIQFMGEATSALMKDDSEPTRGAAAEYEELMRELAEQTLMLADTDFYMQGGDHE